MRASVRERVWVVDVPREDVALGAEVAAEGSAVEVRVVAPHSGVGGTIADELPDESRRHLHCCREGKGENKSKRGRGVVSGEQGGALEARAGMN